jgi:hypothetical protein
MRVVMYHYIRPLPDPDFPHLRALDLDDFRRQLDLVGDRLVPRDVFEQEVVAGRAPDGIVLTFDDGLADHALDGPVCQELRERGMWGVFFAETQATGKRLAVHDCHAALGHFGAETIAARVRSEMAHWDVEPALIPDASRAYQDAWQLHGDERWAKTLVNYGADDAADAAQDAIADMMQQCPARTRAWYANDWGSPSPVRMRGWHGRNHQVMSQLTPRAAESELVDVKHRSGLGEPAMFAYPYGARWSFNDGTIAALGRRGYTHAFMVDPRDATDEDVGRRWYIPRWDCADPATWAGL